VLLLVGGVIAAVLGLGWMAAQIPRKAAVPAYRLHGGGRGGQTLCDPSVLAAAVQDQVDALPGVAASSALLGGTADKPDLTLEVTVNDRADVQDVLARLEASVLTDLSTALEAPLRRCRVLIEATARPQGGALARSTRYCSRPRPGAVRCTVPARVPDGRGRDAAQESGFG
jgi:autotransporter translocation and assembly factor TamB